MHVDDVFRKHSQYLYYAKMLYVAQSLFERGSKDSFIASGLLVPIDIVKLWRKRYEKGQLLKVAADDQRLHQQYTRHDLKVLAKHFFEMGLRSRAVALYLDLPLTTVYSWHKLGGGNLNVQRNQLSHLELYEFSGPKFIVYQSRRRYSYEARQVAKDCFLKGMTDESIAQYLQLERMTVYKWRRAFEQGRFYVNEQEQLLYAHANQMHTFDPLVVEKKATRELSALGFNEKQIAELIHVPLESIKAWKNEKSCMQCSMTSDGLTSSLATDESLTVAPKTSNGRYTVEVRQAALECFEKGYGYKFTAKRLGIAPSVTRDWCRLFKEGRFKVQS